MSRFLKPFILLLALFSSLVAIYAIAQPNAKVIINTSPPAVEIVVPPKGYQHCRVVPSGYYNGKWVNEHRVCVYGNNQGRWVSGYWVCDRYNAHRGVCKHWQWIPSHWEQTAPPAVYVKPIPPQPVAPAPIAIVNTPPPPPTLMVSPPPPAVVIVKPPITVARPPIHVTIVR